ncbi:hypothetical protein MLD38_034602 [Melastoma candidum]|uniref:Uncharacterized protein n=1 Tax=Melastoma candidum TaxID=119954 RepID=A0ACB9MCZ6_9MYRT|nr:hypothetical protein MLD38_034602 [Melastoma candidum]
MWGLREFGVLGLVLGVSWLSCRCRTASADVVLIGRSTTQSFRSVDIGFWDKVRRAQETGLVAVVVYNDEDFGHLVAMSGSSARIKVNAVFVSRSSGDSLKEYAGSTDVELLILPSSIYSAWQRIRLESPQVHHDREFHGMSIRLVNAMPSHVFTSDLEYNSTSQSCAICIDDYTVGEKLWILPCRHKFHVSCVDLQLTSWRTFCPVCKRDARIATGEPPASESTPLLSLASVEPSPVLSSHAQSSVASLQPYR